MFLGSTGEDPRQKYRLAERFPSQVDGLILVSSHLPEERILHHAAPCPLVLVNRDVAGIPRVLIDSGQRVARAIAHLAASGHRRVLYLGGPRHPWFNRQRLTAARQAACNLDLEIMTLRAKMPTHEAGREAAGQVPASEGTSLVVRASTAPSAG